MPFLGFCLESFTPTLFSKGVSAAGGILGRQEVFQPWKGTILSSSGLQKLRRDVHGVLISAACPVASSSPADGRMFLIPFLGDATGGGTCVRVRVFTLLVVSWDYWMDKNFLKIKFGKKAAMISSHVFSVFLCATFNILGLQWPDVRRSMSSYESLCLFSLFRLCFVLNWTY